MKDPQKIICSVLAPVLGAMIAVLAPAMSMAQVDEDATPPTWCTGTPPTAPTRGDGSACSSFMEPIATCIPNHPSPTWTPLCCWDTETAGCKSWSYRLACCYSSANHTYFWVYFYNYEVFGSDYTCNGDALQDHVCFG